MALARLQNNAGEAGHAAKHSDYIQRKGYYKKSLKNGEVLEAVGHGNLPSWARNNPSIFWKASDEFERSNGTPYREFETALPRELNPDQRKALLDDFIKSEIGTTHAYSYAIHCPKAIDGKDQPHFHLMFSERRNDEIKRPREQYFKRYNSKSPEKGGCKKGYGPRAGETLNAAERESELKALRKRWEDVCNKHLELAGRSERIDMRSFKDRGLAIEPEHHYGPKIWGVLKNDPDFKDELAAKRADREKLKAIPAKAKRAELEAQAAVAAVRAEISNPSAEIIELQQAREARQRAAEHAAQKARDDAELQRKIEAERAALEALRQEEITQREQKTATTLETIKQFPNAPKMWAMELAEKGITSTDLDAAKDAYFGLPITLKDVQNNSIYRDRNRSWNNADHAANTAKETEAKALKAVKAARKASEEHKGFWAWAGHDPKGDKLKALWQTAWDEYEEAQTDTTTKVEALTAAKKLLDSAQTDTVKSIKTIRAEQFGTALEELKAIEQKAERLQTLRAQAQELLHTGKITITAKQHNDWREFSEPEKQVIAVYEIKRAYRGELAFMNFSTDVSNSKKIYVHPEQIHDVFEGKEPRVIQSLITSSIDKMKPQEKLAAIRSAVVEVVKRHAAPLVPAQALERAQQQTREALEQPAPKAKQKDRDTFKPM